MSDFEVEDQFGNKFTMRREMKLQRSDSLQRSQQKVKIITWFLVENGEICRQTNDEWVVNANGRILRRLSQ